MTLPSPGRAPPSLCLCAIFQGGVQPTWLVNCATGSNIGEKCSIATVLRETEILACAAGQDQGECTSEGQEKQSVCRVRIIWPSWTTSLQRASAFLIFTLEAHITKNWR